MRDLTRPSDEELKQCNNRRTPRQLFHIAVMGKMPESANFPPEKSWCFTPPAPCLAAMHGFFLDYPQGLIRVAWSC